MRRDAGEGAVVLGHGMISGDCSELSTMRTLWVLNGSLLTRWAEDVNYIQATYEVEKNTFELHQEPGHSFRSYNPLLYAVDARVVDRKCRLRLYSL